MSDLISRQAAIDALWELPSAQTDVPDRKVGDMISRQAAIEEIARWIGYIDEDMILRIQTGLKKLPPEKPEQWIPVSEKPPLRDGRYYVTRHDFVTKADFVDILWYEKCVWWNRQATGDYAVTAWMPLPEPWKGEER